MTREAAIFLGVSIESLIGLPAPLLEKDMKTKTLGNVQPGVPG